MCMYDNVQGLEGTKGSPPRSTAHFPDDSDFSPSFRLGPATPGFLLSAGVLSFGRLRCIMQIQASLSAGICTFIVQITQCQNTFLGNPSRMRTRPIINSICATRHPTID